MSYSVEHTEVTYKIPAVTGPHNATFDQQQYRLNKDGRTKVIVRIIRNSATRPLWHARTDEPRWQDEVNIAHGTLAECQRATVAYLEFIAGKE